MEPSLLQAVQNAPKPTPPCSMTPPPTPAFSASFLLLIPKPELFLPARSTITKLLTKLTSSPLYHLSHPLDLAHMSRGSGYTEGTQQRITESFKVSPTLGPDRLP